LLLSQRRDPLRLVCHHLVRRDILRRFIGRRQPTAPIGKQNQSALMRPVRPMASHVVNMRGYTAYHGIELRFLHSLQQPLLPRTAVVQFEHRSTLLPAWPTCYHTDLLSFWGG